MKRIAIAVEGIAMGIGAMLKDRTGADVRTVERERPVTEKRRRVAPCMRINGRSKYMPHQGAKEQERAARSYMQHYYPIRGPIQTDPLRLRSAPIVNVISKRDFYNQVF